jgi:hypothetical protein
MDHFLARLARSEAATQQYEPVLRHRQACPRMEYQGGNPRSGYSTQYIAHRYLHLVTRTEIGASAIQGNRNKSSEVEISQSELSLNDLR